MCSKCPAGSNNRIQIRKQSRAGNLEMFEGRDRINITALVVTHRTVLPIPTVSKVQNTDKCRCKNDNSQDQGGGFYNLNN